MRKQTSIEWLIEQFELSHYDIFQEDIKKAKEIHKKEITEAFEVGYENGACVNEGEFIYHGSNYYNKKYGSNNEN